MHSLRHDNYREVGLYEVTALLRGPLKHSQKTFVIEKIRFLKPDVAIVQVSNESQNGLNLGTYVMEKQKAG